MDTEAAVGAMVTASVAPGLPAEQLAAATAEAIAAIRDTAYELAGSEDLNSLPGIFRATASRYPDRVALTDLEGARFTYAELDELVPEAGSGEPALIVALDGVEDPRNLGAILRSAYLLGAAGVVIPEHRAAQVTPVVAKSSAGASELLPIVQVGNLVRALDELRELGLWRIAVHATERAQRIDEIDGTLPVCLVLGAEGAGVRPLVARSCDFHAVIPMARSAVGSFNVSVAASIALYEIRRQRLRTRGIPDEA